MFRMAVSLTLLALMFIAPAEVFAADRPQPKSQNADKQSIRVELLAISSAPIEDHGWWDADGNKLTKDSKPEDWKPAAAPQDLERDQIARSLRVKAIVPAGATVNLSVPGQKYSARFPVKLDERSWDDLRKEAEVRGKPFNIEDFETAEYALNNLFVCDRKQRQTYAEIHVTQRAWEDLTRRPHGPEDEKWVTFDFDNLLDSEGQPFEISNDRAEFRIEAEDDTGERHAAAINTRSADPDGSVRSVMAAFKLPNKTLVAYHLVSRPRISFRVDVPLYPSDLPPTERVRIRGGVFGGDRDLLIGVDKNPSPAELDWMNCSDNDVALLPSLESLQRVYIASDLITDRTAKFLADTQQLRHICLTGNQLAPQSLMHLSRSRAEILELRGHGLQQIPSEFFQQLAKSKNLRELRLWDTELTDANLQELAAIDSLRVLCANGLQLTPTGLQQLSHMTALTELRLQKTNWTDETLAALRPLKDLKRIDLSKSSVTNAGLSELARLKSLEWIDLRGTDVTNRGVAELTTLDDLQRLDLRETGCNRGSWNTLSKPFPDIRMRVPPAQGKMIEMAVTVRDPQGDPVPNADVWLFTAENFFARGNQTGQPFPAPPQLGTGKTDEYGQAVIPFNTADRKSLYALWTIAPDGSPANATFSAHDQGNRIERSLRLTNAQATVRVLDLEGNPIPDVQVVPFEIPQEVPRPLFARLGRKTDKSGRVTFQGIALKSIKDIYFRSPQHGEQTTGQIRSSGKPDELSVRLYPTGSLSGRFHGDSGAAYEHLQGTIYVESFGLESSFADMSTQYSFAPLVVDENGDFYIEHLAQGYARFSDETTEGAYRISWDSAKILPGELTSIEADLQAVVRVVGTVRLKDEWQPAEDLPVKLQGGGRRGDRAWHRAVETDETGRFTQQVLPGELEVDVTQFYHNTFTSIDNWQWRNGDFRGAHLVEAVGENRDRVWYLEPVMLVRAVERTGTLVDRNGDPLRQSVYGFPAEPTEKQRVINCVGGSARQDGSFRMFYPHTHPPVRFRGSDRENFYSIKQSDPLILVDETKPEK